MMRIFRPVVPEGELSPHRVVRSFFLRGLALIQLAAFFGWYTQIHALVGSKGISPASTAMEQAYTTEGFWAVLKLPTLFWLIPTDLGLTIMCVAGLLAALTLLVGVIPGPALLAVWVLNVSIVGLTHGVVSYPGDFLLIEMTFVSLFIVPWTPLLGVSPPPPPLGIALLRILFLKVMALSGLAKVSSEVGNWINLSAMDAFFLTQPFPNPLSWYLHQVPSWSHSFVALIIVGLELYLGLMFIGTKGFRVLAFLAFFPLSCMMFIAGSFGFLPFLLLLLCLVLLDDDILLRWTPTPIFRRFIPRDLKQGRLRKYIVIPGAVLIVFFDLFNLSFAIRPSLTSTPRPAHDETINWFNELFASNSRYDLFAHVPLERADIVFEVSADGRSWARMPFRLKPYRATSRPVWGDPFAAPRLDWTLNDLAYQEAERCAEGALVPGVLRGLVTPSSPVIDLFADDPLQGKAATHARARLISLSYVDRDANTDGWWTEGGTRSICKVVKR